MLPDNASRGIGTIRPSPASLSNDYLDEIIADRSGLIWIGTHGSGVDVHDPRRSGLYPLSTRPAGRHEPCQR